MAKEDTCCTLVPYFEVMDGKMPEFRKLCEEFVERTRQEPGCLHYGFSFNGNEVHCREGYKDADAVLAHLKNVDDLLHRALEIARLSRLEVHGPKQELDQLRDPLGEMNAQFFQLDYGFRH